MHYCWLLADFCTNFFFRRHSRKKGYGPTSICKEAYEIHIGEKVFLLPPAKEYLWVRASSSILSPISNTYQWLIFLCSLLFLNTFMVFFSPSSIRVWAFALNIRIDLMLFRSLIPCFSSDFTELPSHFGIIYSGNNKARTQSNSQHNKMLYIFFSRIEISLNWIYESRFCAVLFELIAVRRHTIQTYQLT